MASGRFVLRIPPDLHRKLKYEGQTRGQSLNEVCLEMLSQVDRFGQEKAAKSLAKKIEEALKVEVLGLILFGSAARGEARESSDEDLLIVLPAASPLGSSLYESWDRKLADTLPKNVSPHFVRLPGDSDELGSLWLEVALDGKILFERDSRLYGVLRRARILMAEGKVVRKFAHGHPYWVRKAG